MVSATALLFCRLFASYCFTRVWAQVRASCWRQNDCSSITETAFPGPWEANIFAPDSRIVTPANFVSAETRETIAPYDVRWQGMTLQGNGSKVVLDFGREVGGLVQVMYQSQTEAGADTGARLGFAFTEARDWIGEWSDSSNGGFKGPDGAIYADFFGTTHRAWSMPDEKLRGGFRYLTIFLVTEDDEAGVPKPMNVTLEEVVLEIAFQPTWSNLRAYQGYFHCDDEELNRIWYAGAYTLQTNAVPTDTGRTVPFVRQGWVNNGTLGPGNTIIVDGAKRDRAVWPGDMGVAVPSTFVSVGDLDSVRNALQAMYDNQNRDGSFPEAGPPLLQQGSDTYHMWSMIGTYNYVLYTNDTAFLRKNWPGYLEAMTYITNKQTYPSGLLNVTGLRDWARWQTGFNQSEAQMILYRTLITGVDLASWVGDATGLGPKWTAAAAALQKATLEHCFDNSYGAFRDNATATSLHPQDANSMAILFGVVETHSDTAQRISSALTRNWTPIGAETPELPGNISPFISSFEIQAHLLVGQTRRALDLIRRSWGWYLNNPNGTQSTVVEGYLTNGTFGYRWSRGYGNDFSYVSHAHGWSSGPTSALTEYVLGLSVTGVVGSTWQFAPHFGDLGSAEGGFVTKLGKFRAAWRLSDVEAPGGNNADDSPATERGWSYTANVTTPAGTKGSLVLPFSREGTTLKILVNGKSVYSAMKQSRKNEGNDSTVVVEVGGGEVVIEIR